nr:response regulator transcription factor [uncultured Oscillibacter sp.]
MSKLLLLEDDLSLINGLSFAFQKAGHKVEVARTLHEAENLWQESTYDLLVLDVSLPDGSGFEFCKKVRQTSQVPIIFLTASDTETSIIMGLDMGGDDYITKPFKLAVLMSRINAILRRSRHFQQTPGELCSNGITLHLLEGRAYKNGVLVELTAAEYRLLRFFMERPGVILSAEQIMGNLWDCDGNFVDGNTLAVYIRRLRAKIEDDPARPARIITIRRMGYKWNAGGGTE